MRQLFRLIDWLMELPKGLKTEFSDQVTRYQREKQMPFIDMFEERAMQRGITESIETVLENKFPATSSELMSEIRQIRDYQELKKILQGAHCFRSEEGASKALGQRLR